MRRVVCVAFLDVQVLDVTGPLEVFGRAACLLVEPGARPGRVCRDCRPGGQPIATTHWVSCERLATMYPRMRVESDPIFIRDGAIYTSTGVTAAMDLALAMVEENFGRGVALGVARQLVMFLRRPGGQSQFSTQFAVQTTDRQPLRELVGWIADHLDDLSVPALAARADMSPRHFARVFAAEVQMTPARFVELHRVEAARRRLEESSDGVERVVTTGGFGNAEVMRRAFLRTVRVSPADYRNRFRSSRRLDSGWAAWEKRGA